MGDGEKYSPDRQEELLKNYLKVPRDLYDTIHGRSHLRFIMTDGSFNLGGFVSRNDYDATKPRFLMRNTYNYDKRDKTIRSWSVAFDDIDAIYIRMPTELQLFHINMTFVMKKINENFQRLGEKVEMLAKVVAGLKK